MTKSAKNSRRFVIYGAGAIGGVLGSQLALAGKEVILIGRSGHVNSINEHGLRFVSPAGTHLLKVAAVTTPGQVDFGPNDLVCLCVKSQDTEPALRDLRAVVRDIPVFCLQNGVRNEETAAKYFPTVYGVTLRLRSVFVTNGEVMARQDPPGRLIMGRYPTGTDALVESAAADLRDAGFHVLVTPEIMPYKWGKLMMNLANAIVAITNAKREDNSRIIEATQDEAETILRHAGIRWISREEQARQWPELNIEPRGSLTIEAQSSTWQSLARRQGTVETDFLNGEIVKVARRLGKPAPINETLLRMTKEMAANREPPGKYTTAELIKILGLE